MNLRIEEVDLSDREQVGAWRDVMYQSYAQGREAVFWVTADAAFASFNPPKPGRRIVVLRAMMDGQIAGGLEALADANGDPIQAEAGVLPEFRRRGVGSALVKRAVEALGERAGVTQTEVFTGEGVAFAEKWGMSVGHEELRLLLSWPVDIEALREAAGPNFQDVEVMSWVGACPTDILEDWVRLSTQMNEDVPLGSLTRSAPLDVARARQNDERMIKQGYLLVRSLARYKREPVGYTEILVPKHEPAIAVQDETLVQREHRGRGIATALKIANLQQLAAVPESHEIQWIQTFTSPTNTAMLALNQKLGFVITDRMRELEGSLTTSRG